MSEELLVIASKLSLHIPTSGVPVTLIILLVCVSLAYLRLFLTMDPVHGEISRAMRNRGVEIFLLPEVSVLLILTLFNTCNQPGV